MVNTRIITAHYCRFTGGWWGHGTLNNRRKCRINCGNDIAMKAELIAVMAHSYLQ